MQHPPTRRGLLAATAGLTASGIGGSRAQVEPVIRLGVMSDFSGPYREWSGPTTLACVNQAVAEMRRMHPGLRIEALQADHQNKPDVGANTAREWFDRREVDAIVDVNNSAVGLAVSGVAREKNKVWSWPASADAPRLRTEVFKMARFRAACPPEFRRQMVDLVRSGRTPEELAREFEPTAQSIWAWVRKAERDGGKQAAGWRDQRGARRAEPFAPREPVAAPGARHPGKGGGLVRAGGQGGPERVFRFMSAHQAEFPVAAMARVLGVSTSGYYGWRGRPASARAAADDALLRRVRTVHASSRGTYGAPRIHAELKAEGVAVGRKRVARLMRAAGLAGVSRRRGFTTTRREPDRRPANDLVGRDFTAPGPNRLWVADIT